MAVELLLFKCTDLWKYFTEIESDTLWKLVRVACCAYSKKNCSSREHLLCLSQFLQIFQVLILISLCTEKIISTLTNLYSSHLSYFDKCPVEACLFYLGVSHSLKIILALVKTSPSHVVPHFNRQDWWHNRSYMTVKFGAEDGITEV